MNAQAETKTDDVAKRVYRVIADQMGLEESGLKPESKIVDDLGADSLDAVEVVMALEDEFELVIDDEEAAELKTVQQVVDYIAKLIAG